jgi:hypothetical protein
LTAGRDQQSRLQSERAVTLYQRGGFLFRETSCEFYFSKDFDNVFRVDANRVGFAKEKNDMEISWRANSRGSLKGISLPRKLSALAVTHLPRGAAQKAGRVNPKSERPA